VGVGVGGWVSGWVGGGVGWLDGEMGVLGMGASTARRGRRIFSIADVHNVSADG
jgi:hypothetical protein